MGNKQNLIQFSGRQSSEEARKNGRKGGIASGAARRQRKELRQLTTDLMLSEAIEPYKEIIKQLCPEMVDSSNMAAVVARLFDVVMTGNGSEPILAARTLLEWSGMLLDQITHQAATEVASGASETKEESQIIFYKANQEEIRREKT